MWISNQINAPLLNILILFEKTDPRMMLASELHVTETSVLFVKVPLLAEETSVNKLFFSDKPRKLMSDEKRSVDKDIIINIWINWS